MPTSDKDLPLAPGEYERGVRIGQVLAKRHELGQLVLPDRLVISPTARTSSTAKAIVEGFPRLAAKLHEHPEMIAEDPNVVERLTGDSAEKYSDTKIFFGNHPEVYKERRDMGEDRAKLRFCYPGGESMLDVIERARAWESGRAPTEKIWMFTHMLFSIAFRLYQEGFDGGDTALQRYLYILRNESPPTGSLSTYIHSQETGRLVLHKLNEVLA
jgi:broad specificity phosphatase PhoE